MTRQRCDVSDLRAIVRQRLLSVTEQRYRLMLDYDRRGRAMQRGEPQVMGTPRY